MTDSAMSHLDSETISMLKEVMEDGFVTLLQTYLDDSKSRIAALHQALDAGDSDAVRRTAHSLKGSSGNLGAKRMAELCLHVENCGKDGNLDGLADEIGKIEIEFTAVSDIMQQMI